MSDTYNFQLELKNSIFNADPKIDRKELLVDIFKSYVAKLFEKVLTKEKLPFEALVQIKNNLINEFRQAELSEYQKTTEQYDQLFDNTVKEILNLAAARHKGIDTAVRGPQELIINPEIYIHEKGGLIKPVSSL
jgi:hypothetical protein